MTELDDHDIEPPGEPDPVVCPNCGAPEIRRRQRAVIFAVVAFIAACIGIGAELTEAAFFLIAAAAIFAVISDRWACDACGETWK